MRSPFERKQVMRKLLMITPLLFGLLAVSAPSSAQGTGYSTAAQAPVKTVRLGFLTKPALTWLTADNQELNSKGVRAGFSFGFMVDFTIARNNNYAVATGLMLNMADGGKLKSDELREVKGVTGLQHVKSEMNTNYQWLEVPLTLKLKTNQIGYMTYFGHLGLQGGVKLSAKQSGEYHAKNGPNVTPETLTKENINSDTRLFNAGLLVGIGVEYNISGSTNLVFGVNYYRGFTNVLKGNVYQIDKDGDIAFTEFNDESGNQIPATGSKRSAILSNISLSVGVLF